MNKKAQFLTSMRFISVFKTLFIMIIGFILLLYAISATQVDEQITKKLLDKIYAEQLINNPQCFAYEDIILKKVSQGIIDKEKFTKKRLEDCLTFGRTPPIRLLPAQATLIIPSEDKEIKIETTQWFASNTGTVTKIFSVYIQEEQLVPATLIISFNPMQVRGIE